MKLTMKRLLLAATLGFAPAAAPAQTAPASQAAPAAAAVDADPALWVVRDDDTTIYLFGTFHLLDGRPWFNDEVKTAFDGSNELVVEANIPENPMELQPVIMRYAIDPQGRSLAARLTPEHNAELARALTALGAPAAAFERFEPWFVAMTMTAVATQQLGLNQANGPETVLLRSARERDLPIHELEGIEAQLQMFDTMPEEQQLAHLRQALDNLDGLAGMLAPMLAAWSTGDVDELKAMLTRTMAGDPALYRMMFTDRNARWAAWIQERMARPGTVFLAVGGGHLAGDDSVQA